MTKIKLRPDNHHSFQVVLAINIGIPKAILAEEIYRFCVWKLENNREVYGNYPFVYMTYEYLSKKMKYMNPKTISRQMIEMEQSGLIYSSNKLNKKGYDKTKNYTINFDLYYKLCDQEKTKATDMLWLNEIKGIFDNITLEAAETLISQNEESISQNEETIPPLTTPPSLNSLKGKIGTNTPNEAHVTRDQRLEPKVIANQIQTSTAPIDPADDEWDAKTEKRSHRSSGEAVGASTPRPHSQKLSKEEREAAFRKQAAIFTEKYDEEMITAFCDYWTESNPTGLKLKFELQKIFDISRRLAMWDKNNINRKWKTSSAINTSPDLDNYDLPPDLLTKYNNYLESVQQNFPALLKSNCRIYSKDDFFDLSTDRTVTARRNRITDRKYQELWIQAHRDLVEKAYLRTEFKTVYDYTRKLMRQELEYA